MNHLESRTNLQQGTSTHFNPEIAQTLQEEQCLASLEVCADILHQTQHSQALSWKIYKIYDQMKLFEFYDNQHLILKAEWRVEQQFQSLISLLDHQGCMYHYQPFLKSLVARNDAYLATYTHHFKGHLQNYLFQFEKYSTAKQAPPSQQRRTSYFILIRKHASSAPQILFEVLTCVTSPHSPNICDLQLILKCHPVLSPAQRAFLNEYLTNYSILSYESHHILYLINELAYFSASVLQIPSASRPCDYFIPNDREDYFDPVQDNHSAFQHVQKFERINALTQQEKSIFESFKTHFAHLGLNDNTLIRHLQARQFDFQKAATALTEVLEWRKANNVNEIVHKDFQFFQDQKILLTLGEGVLGTPILYINTQNVLPDNFTKTGPNTLENFISFFCFKLETHCRRMRANQDCQIMVIDCLNLSRKNVSLDMIRNLIMHVFKNYPERQMRNIVINSNWLSMSVYNMIKRFLPQRSINKMAFAGSDVKEIFEVLNRDIPAEVIPKRYGGGNIIIT